MFCHDLKIGISSLTWLKLVSSVQHWITQRKKILLTTINGSPCPSKSSKT